ncbi:MAG: hypothetical protein AAFX05_11200 [Planctomycetota bacterium]
MTHKSCLAAAIAGTLVTSGICSAGMILPGDLPDGVNQVMLTVDGVDVTVTANGGDAVFDTQNFNSVSGTGVAGGTFAEVDGQESMTFAFSVPVTLTQIGFAHVYPQGTFTENDPVGESVIVTTDQGVFTFQPTSVNTGTWTGPGAVSNVDPGNSSGGGSWSIDGPDIIGLQITSITLTPGAGGTSTDDDDFSFTGLQFVPSPGSATMLALAGAVTLRRRRN